MISSSELPVRTRYTATVALLLLAFLVSPAVLFASTTLHYVPVSIAVAVSTLCLCLAWTQWKPRAEPPVLTILSPQPRGSN